MKKSIVIISLLLVTISVSFAQNFRPFKVGLGLGFTVPTSGNGGRILYLEPGYRVNNMVLVGLRIENAVFAPAVTNATAEETSNVSYSLVGQYYFNENRVRPFVGAGLGLFRLADVKYNTGAEVLTANQDMEFGFYPRVGLDIGHLNLTLDYNIIPTVTVGSGVEVKNSYLGLRGGFSIGGGEGIKQK